MSGPETESFHDAIPSVDLSAVYEDEDSEGEVAICPACTPRPPPDPMQCGLPGVHGRLVERVLACVGGIAQRVRGG